MALGNLPKELQELCYLESEDEDEESVINDKRKLLNYLRILCHRIAVSQSLIQHEMNRASSPCSRNIYRLHLKIQILEIQLENAKNLQYLTDQRYNQVMSNKVLRILNNMPTSKVLNILNKRKLAIRLKDFANARANVYNCREYVTLDSNKKNRLKIRYCNNNPSLVGVDAAKVNSASQSRLKKLYRKKSK